MKSTKYVIGIDEVGRGPLAGPVFVGAVMVPYDFDWTLVQGVRDSKKLSPKAREEWYEKLDGLRKTENLDFATASSSPEMVDQRGIVPSISRALEECLNNIAANPATCEIRLDGSLYAPEHFLNQKTIIHGDDLEPIISMASIVAKVRRDNLMKELAVQFPGYGFEVHKGYGTAAHCSSIRKHGLCTLHRKSFCTRLV